VRPAYLGTAGDLFGCYHPARPSRPVAAVLCPALFGEHVQQFRLLHLLAERIARAGAPVLRLDWFGTGDSAGDLADASTERWDEDLGTAATWLLRQSRCDRLVLVGFRAGATLATRYAATAEGSAHVAGVALWDPVVNGADYLIGLRAVHRKNLGGYLPDDPPEELLGFYVSLALQDDLAGLRLAALPGVPAYLTGANAENLRRAATVLGGPVEVDPAVMPAGWLAPDDGIYDVLVPAAPLAATVAWVGRLAKGVAR